MLAYGYKYVCDYFLHNCLHVEPAEIKLACDLTYVRLTQSVTGEGGKMVLSWSIVVSLQ